MTPRATLRLQLHRDFTFDDAAAQIDYADRLGISHLYLSPILTARPGSQHGYDVIDHGEVNPELGGESGLRRLVAALRRRRMGLIVDIVPNHMAADTRNARWRSVLQAGPASPNAGFFDIDWQSPDETLRGKLLLPILGAPYGEVLDSGALSLLRDEDGLSLRYGDHRLPIRAEDQASDSTSGDALHALLERQHYRLTWWRTAGDQINWRRFFDVNELVGVSVERPEVFDAVHALTLRLYAEGLLDGLRIDHIDGLTDPLAYCQRLREALSIRETERPAGAPRGPAYLVVEKILARGEKLSPDWPVDGTTGYDFMDRVSALLHAAEGEEPLDRLWQALSGRAGFAAEEQAARRDILESGFAGQLDATARAFHSVARASLATRDITGPSLHRVLTAFLSVFPVYRTYVTPQGAPASDAPIVRAAGEAAAVLLKPADLPALAFVQQCLLAPRPQEGALRAAVRFQQVSAPLAAKAVEDTAFYRQGRLLSRNDVGFDAATLADAPSDFHAYCADRARHWPATLLATATHDHKRGEDLRARLAVLSEVPALWAEQVGAWFLAHAERRPLGLSHADEYQLYQMLVGAWPPNLRPDDSAGLGLLRERLAQWQVKALREAKLRSSWVLPDEDYEGDAGDFLRRLLDSALSPGFLAELAAFVGRIAAAGALNGLTQTLLRCTAPGVPDLYQGCDYWDFSLVDPDNRRAVDFTRRGASLGPDVAALLADWTDGRVKQALIAALLTLRRHSPTLFAAGRYDPVAVEGRHADRVVAYLRRTEDEAVLIAGCRLCAPPLLDSALPLPARDSWEDTALLLPGDLGARPACDVLAEGTIATLGQRVQAAGLFASLPVSVWIWT